MEIPDHRVQRTLWTDGLKSACLEVMNVDYLCALGTLPLLCICHDYPAIPDLSHVWSGLPLDVGILGLGDIPDAHLHPVLTIWKLLDCPPAYSSYSWFNPRLREMTSSSSSKKLSDLPEHTDPAPENSDPSAFDGFEFRLEDPVKMLPADELFSDGKLLLQRNSKASLSNDASVNAPLLDNEAVTISSRASLSSSSSSNHSLDDLPRLSLDSDKPNKSISTNTRPKTRMVKTNARATTRGNRQATRRSTDASDPRAANPVTIDSPRMNSSGKIVFQHLERSSSSPSSLNGGPRYKHRVGVMERSYSANVRITPVLNVPVCSLRGSSSKSVGGVFGFPIFSSSSSSQQNKQRGSGGEGNSSGNVSNRSQRFNGKSKTDNGLSSQC
ncbi:hypothetical protein CTI12_AA013730 [Artemisia annua]|uniref:Uncharacterized protein n=1 Tax=Artemisia annua TaxID=35608 RepID=A0A2U1QLV4_ARTAN|nr:hypothetical protein CTI12_AA013730 [Artemisia annua]